MEHQCHRCAAQHRGAAPQTTHYAAPQHRPYHQGQNPVHVADLIGPAGEESQQGGTHGPALVAGILAAQQAQPGGHGPEQGFLGYSVVAVHALVENGGQAQGQGKSPQPQGAASAEPCGQQTYQKSRCRCDADNVQPVTAQAAEKQQRHRRRIVKREETHLFQGEVTQPPAQVLQQILPEGHALQIIQPAVDGQAVIALQRHTDGHPQVHHAGSQYQQVSGCQQQPAVAAAKGGDLFHQKGPPRQ